MKILGISAGYHDAAAAVVENGNILFAGHAERYSKKKNDSRLNSALIGDCLIAAGGDIDQVAFYERPWLKKTRQLYSGEDSNLFSGWTTKQLKKDLYRYGVEAPITCYSHHLSHAAAGFQTSPFNDASVVVIDAIGEWDTVSIWDAHYDENGIAKYKKVWSQKYPHSIGLMYSAFTQQVGLKPMEEEYILMGMSSYYNDSNLGHLMACDVLEDDWMIKLKDNYHIGVPKHIQETYETLSDNAWASAAQDILERLVERVLMRARSDNIIGKNLVYAGGVALNCLANRNLGYYFDNIWIMPNPGDAGSSLGAAALKYGKKLNWQGPYLGYTIKGKYPVNAVCGELIHNKIAGVANGPAEFGPRALGNRSLLADPRVEGIRDKVNQIKHRQEFRPFAPVILEEYVYDYFTMPLNVEQLPYMQYVAKCKYPEKFPGIVHVDGTSRVQTVPKDCKSGIRQLLEFWYFWTGCPMLLNTSLNIRGEPMVNDVADAIRFENLYGVKVFTS